MRFLPKVIIVCTGEKTGLDYKNNDWCHKLTNFRLDIISKINYIIIVVISHIFLGLELKKV